MPQRPIDVSRLLALVDDLAERLLTQYEAEDALASFGPAVAELLDVEGAGVMIEDAAGALRFVAASDPTLLELEKLQLELDEGPCLHAYRTGHDVLAPDLANDPRFTRFGPRAIAAGMAAVYSFALRADDVVVGALNLYAGEPGELDPEHRRAARSLAKVATVSIAYAADLRAANERVEQLQTALERRIVTEQAKGYLAALAGLSPEEVRERLRAYARSQRLPLPVVARRVLDGELGADAILG